MKISEVGIDSLQQYVKISIAFDVETILRVQPLDDGLGGIVNDLATGRPVRDYPRACWIDTVRDLPDANRLNISTVMDLRINPYVKIQSRTGIEVLENLTIAGSALGHGPRSPLTHPDSVSPARTDEGKPLAGLAYFEERAPDHRCPQRSSQFAS